MQWFYHHGIGDVSDNNDQKGLIDVKMEVNIKKKKRLDLSISRQLEIWEFW